MLTPESIIPVFQLLKQQSEALVIKPRLLEFWSASSISFGMADLPNPHLPEIFAKGCLPSEPDLGMVDGHSELASFERKTMYVL